MFQSLSSSRYIHNISSMNFSYAWTAKTPIIPLNSSSSSSSSVQLSPRRTSISSYRGTHSRNRSHIRATMSPQTASSEPLAEQQKYMTGDIDHIALACHLPPIEVARWYRDVLGFAPIKFEEYQAGKFYFPSVRLSVATILDFMSPPSSSPESETTAKSGLSPNTHMCVCVSKSSFDALMERLKEHKVEYSHPPRKLSGARGHGWATYFKDIDGNTLEFRYYDEN